ncbi:HAMP domain-containing histidine kinase [bacterium]|nr:HAMP domain-containing histidine kinase [bacterium]
MKKTIINRILSSRKSTLLTKPGLMAFLLALGYLILAGTYILISSSVAGNRAVDVEHLKVVEIEKGLIFVVITGALLGMLTWFLFSLIREREKKIVNQRDALIKSERTALAGLISSSVAHDINNLLASSQGNLDLLKMTIGDDKTLKKRLERVGESNRKLAVLAKRLMKASQYEQIDKSLVSLNKLIYEGLIFSRTHQEIKFCEVMVKQDEQIEINGNRGLLEQMLFNLILNAAQATDGKGKINITAHRDEKDFLLVIEDNGPGISEKDMEKIFDPFYTTKENGTGLGMTSVMACVESHDGEMDISRSTELGGAKITLRFSAK